MTGTEFEQLFIIGAPRSGTTLLAGLLKKTRYGAPIETHFITKYFRDLSKYGDISKFNDFSRLIRDISNERPVMQWNIEIDPAEVYERTRPDFSYANVVNQLMALRVDAAEKCSWGDKTPHYIGRLPWLVELFPEAKFIYIVRDGRDVSLSLLEKEWGPKNVLACAEYWRDLNSQNETIEQLFQDGRLKKVKYEDLIAEPEGIVRELYEFLGAPVAESEIQELCRNIKSNNSDKWRSKMSDRQKFIFEAVAGGKLKELGYPLLYEKPTVSRLGTFVYRLGNRLGFFAFLVKTNLVDGFRIRFLGKQPFNE